jgi:PAS domain S-box-containing protein
MNYEDLEKAYQELQAENAVLKQQIHTFTTLQKEAAINLPEAERKAKQEAAQKNAILQAIPDHIFIMNDGGVYIDYLGNKENLYNSTEVIGSNIRDTNLPKDIIEQILIHNKRALESNELQLAIYSLPNNDNGVSYHESRSIKYTDNLVMRLVRDITERKKAEERIKLAETYKRIMLKVIPDMILLISAEGDFIDLRGSYNKTFMFDYEIGSNINKTQMPQGVIDMWLEDNLMALESGEVQFSEYKIDIGEESYYYESRTVRYTRKQVLKIVRDITERRQAEEKSRAEESRKNAILRAIPDMIFVMNDKGDYIDFRGGHGKVFIDPDLIIGSNITNSKMPEAVQKQLEINNQKALETGEIQLLEYSLDMNGKIHHYESRAIRYTKNQVLRIVRDITEQTDAQQQNLQLVAELQMLNEELVSSEEEIRQTLDHALELKHEIEKRGLYYHTLLTSSPDMVVCINQQMKIEFFHLPHISNDDIDKYIGLNFLDTIPDKDTKEKAQKALKIVFETAQPTEYESMTINPTLGLKNYYTYFSPIISNRKVISAYSVTRDITKTKAAENRIKDLIRNLQTTIDNSIQSTILLDKQGNIMLADTKTIEKFYKFFGKQMIIGSHIINYIPDDLRESFMVNMAKSFEGEHIRVERKVKTKLGVLWTDIIYSPVFDENGTVNAVVLAQMDITERKESEEYLRKVNDELLNQNKQLAHYSYVVSHNLRAPVATILGLLSLFEMEESSNPNSKELLSMLKEATDKLDNVVKDLNVILSETQIVQEDKQIVSFEEELLNIMGNLRIQIQNCKAEIDYNFDKAITIFASKTFIHNVLLNLLTNAMKFRRRNINPEVFIETEIIDNYICLSITDNGLGIDVENQEENLFKLYKRFHPQIEGKGIGLYILKTQVEMQGGKVELISEVNVGTTFKVYFAKEEQE